METPPPPCPPPPVGAAPLAPAAGTVPARTRRRRRFRPGTFLRVIAPYLRPHRVAGGLLGLSTLPDFIIIGAQKSGTTSLYHHLCAQPGVRPALRKEVHFFDNHFGLGLRWYRLHFPLRRGVGRPFVTGEATPNYLFHPRVPERIAAALPGTRFIVILRNPTERAYSHWAMSAARGHESLPFGEAVAREPERLAACLRGRGLEDRDQLHAYMRLSYVARGRYVEQLRRWTALIPRERFLVIPFENLIEKTTVAMDQIRSFLGLPSPAGGETPFPLLLPGKYRPPLAPETRARLNGLFDPYHQELKAFLGMDLDCWK